MAVAARAPKDHGVQRHGLGEPARSSNRSAAFCRGRRRGRVAAPSRGATWIFRSRRTRANRRTRTRPSQWMFPVPTATTPRAATYLERRQTKFTWRQVAATPRPRRTSNTSRRHRNVRVPPRSERALALARRRPQRDQRDAPALGAAPAGGTELEETKTVFDDSCGVGMLASSSSRWT